VLVLSPLKDLVDVKENNVEVLTDAQAVDNKLEDPE
jgi:hypothetical protein